MQEADRGYAPELPAVRNTPHKLSSLYIQEADTGYAPELPAVRNTPHKLSSLYMQEADTGSAPELSAVRIVAGSPSKVSTFQTYIRSKVFRRTPGAYYPALRASPSASGAMYSASE
jgi:hypothetical protein